MLTSKECWLKDTCVRYKETNECDDDIYCTKLFKLNYLYDAALLTKSQRKRIGLFVDSDGTDSDKFKLLKDIEKNIEQFIKEGGNLYIHSTTCGNGKTAWSLRMIQAYFNSIWAKSNMECKALFINVPRFLLALKDNISEKSEYIDHIKKNIYKADLVVWDDIATKSTTTFETEQLLSLINARMDSELSNIFTSNIIDSELPNYVGERLASRIIGFSENIVFNGKDKRSLR